MAEDGSPGWAAIDAALAKKKGGREPFHYGTIVKASLGGPDPLDGISVYAETSPAHWHYVTYGFSELYTKESEDPETSGFGFELTFRLARPEGPSAPPEPPRWPLDFLQNLARYVFKSGNAFEADHYINLNGPIATSEKTAISAAVFARDPELPAIETPHGKLAFLQVVGITLDELDAIMDWDSERFLGVLARESPLLVTDLARPSLFADAAKAREIQNAIEREGSATDTTFVSGLAWTEKRDATPPTVEITLPALGVTNLTRLLRGRTRHGRHFALVDRGSAIRVLPAERASFCIDGGTLVLELTREIANELAVTLRPRRGSSGHPGLPGVVFNVVPSEIKDAQGKVVRTIG